MPLMLDALLPHHDPGGSRSSGIGVRKLIVVGLVLAIVVASCGRSAPTDALPDTDGDPDIAGVSVTSPDAVVETQPTQPGESTVPVETTAPAPAPGPQVLHVVQPGDTLSGIATSYGLTIQQVADANAIVDVNSLQPGQELVIPTAPEAAPAPAPAEPETTITAQPSS